MPQKRAGWGLVVGGLVFLFGALWPLLRGSHLNATLLTLAVVFFVVGLAKARVASLSVTPPNNG
jgi:hypothetical protein